MGWMNRKSSSTKQQVIVPEVEWGTKSDLLPSVAFFEDVNDPNLYKPASLDTTNADLPFIDPAIVIAAGQNGLLWVIIDDTIYDCTKFVHEHPGGTRVLESFRSSNCSWQFWRFHSEKDLIDFGKPLRIGRTQGIGNRFKEPPRFIGLRKPWASD